MVSLRKISIIALLLISFSFLQAQETVTIEYKGESYTVTIPEDENALKDAYIQMAESYIQEAADFEELQDTFDTYRDSSEKTIEDLEIVRDTLFIELKKKDELVEALENKIKILEASEAIALVPKFVYKYDYMVHKSNYGIGLGFIIYDGFYIEAEAALDYVGVGIGWRF